MKEIASRYGDALFLLALENNKVNEYQSEMKSWEEIFDANKEIYRLLSSSLIDKDERKKAFQKIAKDMDDSILSFFMIIIDNNRVKYIPYIFQAFNSRCNEHKGVKEGIIFSTTHLDKKVISSINEKIGQKENLKVDLRNEIDKSLIGGIKVVIGDHVYDDSLKYHLEQMRSKLLKKEDINDEN